jgi:hypothetical protein
MTITVDVSRGGDAALDDYYRQSYALGIIRLRGLLAMIEVEQLLIVPAGTAAECFGGLPLGHYADRLLKLVREDAAIAAGGRRER